MMGVVPERFQFWGHDGREQNAHFEAQLLDTVTAERVCLVGKLTRFLQQTARFAAKLIVLFWQNRLGRIKGRINLDNLQKFEWRKQKIQF